MQATLSMEISLPTCVQLDFVSLMRCKIQARAVFQESIEEKTKYSVSNAFIM